MSRWKASALHLGISILLVSALAALLALSWYPPAYAWAMGGLGLIAILAGVDVGVGPLLTLVVWDARKPSLRFDMAVIVLLQALAFGYGVYAIFQARPVYLVFAKDRFELVTVANIPDGETEKASREEFRSLPLAGPEVIAAQEPADHAERERLMFAAVSGGADLAQLPRYYVPYAEMAAAAIRKARPLGPLMQRDPVTRDAVSAYLARKSLDPSGVKFLPLRAKRHDQTVLLDAATGNVLDILNVDPWP